MNTVKSTPRMLPRGSRMGGDAYSTSGPGTPAAPASMQRATLAGPMPPSRSSETRVGQFACSSARGRRIVSRGASPSSSDESSFGMSTLTSLDTRTGGYKGWGPMANFMGPASSPETNPIAQIDLEREHRQHVAEVQAERQQVWVANAPLRSEYENIGATRSEAGGFGGFFSRDRK